MPEIASRQHIEWIRGVVEDALAEAGATVAELDARGRHPSAGPDRVAAGGPLLRQGSRLGARAAPRRRGPHPGAPLRPAPRAATSTTPTSGCWSRAATRSSPGSRAGTRSRCSARRSTTPAARHSTRWRSTTAWASPAGWPSTGSRRPGDPRRVPLPEAEAAQGRRALRRVLLGSEDRGHPPARPVLERESASGASRTSRPRSSSTAVDILVDRLLRAAEDTGLRRVVAGGGVAANSWLRARLGAERGLEVIFPPLSLCTDNAAMVAGLGWRLVQTGRSRASI